MSVRLEILKALIAAGHVPAGQPIPGDLFARVDELEAVEVGLPDDDELTDEAKEYYKKHPPKSAKERLNSFLPTVK